LQSLLAESLHIPALVLEAALLQQDECWVYPVGRGPKTMRYREIEGSPVATGQEMGEV
jgi:hypothetical protein